MLLKKLAINHTGTNIRKAVKLPNVVDDRNGIVDYIAEEDLGHTDSRTDGVINGGLIHATSLKNICPRYISICRKLKKNINLNEVVDSNTRIIWAMGRSMENHIRGQLIKQFPKDSVIGDITCRCEHTVKSISPTGHKKHSDDHCSICKSSVSIYRESPIVLNKYGTICSFDFGYFNYVNKAVIVEIKSIKKDNFLALKQAQPEHIEQAYLYHLAGAEIGGDMADYVKIVYGSKGWINPKKEGYPYKEFTVKITDHKLIYEKNQLLLENRGLLIKNIDVNGDIPEKYDCGDGLPEKICETSSDDSAKQCDQSSICFQWR